MLTDADRLEKLEKLLDDLLESSEEEAIIVEGSRDVKALKSLGIQKNIRAINVGNSIVNFIESLSTEYDRFIILTDWDRKGGQLAMLIRKALESSDLKYDDQIRRMISILTKKDIKDVESLPSYMDRLRKSVQLRMPAVLRNARRSQKD